MVDPVTAAVIASAISAGAKGLSDFYSNQKSKKGAKLKAKETKRETLADMAHEAHEGSADLEAHGMGSRLKSARRKSKSLQDTTDIVRGAFNR